MENPGNLPQIYYGVVYLITNKIDGKRYVGRTKNFEKRKREHIVNSRSKNPASKIAKAIKRHGVNNFEFNIIISTYNKESLYSLEALYINIYDSISSGYNMKKESYTFTEKIQNTKYKIQNTKYKKVYIPKKSQILSNFGYLPSININDLSKSAIKLYLYLSKYQKCVENQNFIATRIGIRSNQAISNAAQELTKHNLLEVKQQMYGCAIYSVLQRSERQIKLDFLLKDLTKNEILIFLYQETMNEHELEPLMNLANLSRQAVYKAIRVLKQKLIVTRTEKYKILYEKNNIVYVNFKSN